VDFKAPARRVALGFQDNLLSNLTSDGAAILDSAFQWAASITLATRPNRSASNAIPY